jgi:hypothetical protein
MTELTGEQFNKQYKGSEFYKLLNDNLIHNNYKYENGLNIDKNFNNLTKCSDGFYFTNKDNIPNWIFYSENLKYLCKIIVPNDAIICAEDDNFKTDKIILNFNKLILIKDFYDFCKIAVTKNGYALKYVKEQTDEICKLAVQKHGRALEYVNKQTDKICKIAVQQNGFALQYVKEQTDEICKLAVTQNGYALQNVKEQTDEICKIAVTQNGNALCYVKEQTEEICKIAMH